VLFVPGYTGDLIILNDMMEKGVVPLQKPFSAQSPGRRVRDVIDGP